MEAKFTKGPWRNCEPSSNFQKGKKIIRPDGGDKAIAEVTRNYGFSESEANARLIAAAPALYGELDAISAALEAGDTVTIEPGSVKAARIAATLGKAA